MANRWKNRIVGYGEEAPDQMLANPRNWRIHPKHQQDALSGVLDEVGWVQDVLINKTTGYVVDGHLRVAMAISRGEKAVPVKYVELTEAEEAKIIATLDPLSALAVADADVLAELLAQVATDDAAIQKLLDEIAAEAGLDLGEELAEDPGARLSEAEALQEKYGVELGQVWEMDSHRLAVGDCTDKAVVEAVMRGERAGAVVTDPPYGIGYHSNQPGWKGERVTDRDFGQDVFDSTCLIKTSSVIYAPEGMFGHPTQKHLGIIGPLVSDGAGVGDIVADPFVGSGTTGIACERLGRKARMVEIDPGYCGVILERMSGMGLTPRLLE